MKRVTAGATSVAIAGHAHHSARRMDRQARAAPDTTSHVATDAIAFPSSKRAQQLRTAAAEQNRQDDDAPDRSQAASLSQANESALREGFELVRGRFDHAAADEAGLHDLCVWLEPVLGAQRDVKEKFLETELGHLRAVSAIPHTFQRSRHAPRNVRCGHGLTAALAALQRRQPHGLARLVWLCLGRLQTIPSFFNEKVQLLIINDIEPPQRPLQSSSVGATAYGDEGTCETLRRQAVLRKIPMIKMRGAHHLPRPAPAPPRQMGRCNRSPSVREALEQH